MASRAASEGDVVWNSVDDAARRLLAREIAAGIHGSAGSGAHDAIDEAAFVAGAERLSQLLSAGLVRWFGAYGARALVARALARAQEDHAELAAMAVAAAPSSSLIGIAATAREHGAMAMSDGVVAVFAALAEGIGRLIGDDLAMNLLEQSASAARGRPMSAPRALPGAAGATVAESTLNPTATPVSADAPASADDRPPAQQTVNES